jgi:hypothetical protein
MMKLHGNNSPSKPVQRLSFDTGIPISDLTDSYDANLDDTSEGENIVDNFIHTLISNLIVDGNGW